MQQLNASTINGAKDYIADGGLKISFNCNNMYADASFVEAFNKWLDGKKKGVKEEVEEKEDVKVKEPKIYDPTKILPPELHTPKAMAIWKELQELGYIKENYMPANNLTMGMASYIAKWMGRLLNIKKFCVVFSGVWGYNKKSMSARLSETLDYTTLEQLIEDTKRIENKLYV